MIALCFQSLSIALGEVAKGFYYNCHSMTAGTELGSCPNCSPPELRKKKNEVSSLTTKQIITNSQFFILSPSSSLSPNSPLCYSSLFHKALSKGTTTFLFKAEDFEFCFVGVSELLAKTPIWFI